MGLLKPRLLLALLVIGADGLLKAALPTHDWAYDPRPFSAAAAVFGVAACAMLFAFPPSRLAAALLFAGVAGNLLSASRPPVANPFVIGDLAFNLADVALLAGFMVLLASTPNVYRWWRTGRPARLDIATTPTDQEANA